MKKKNGFSLISTIIIIVVTAVVSGIATGVIMYNSYKQSTGLTYKDITNDPALKEFLEVYASILDDYYQDIDKEAMLEEAMSAMMDYLGDTYTTYLTQEETEALEEKLAGEYKGIGITIKDRIIVDVAKNSPAMNVGIMINDIIIKINDENVENRTASEIANMIKEANEEKVKLTILRGEAEKTFEINLSTLYIPAISTEIIEENSKKIGYIYIGTFSNTLAAQIDDALNEFKTSGIESIILDVRDNSGGYLTAASDVASLFLKKGQTIYSLEDKDSTEVILDETDAYEEYEMLVLINKNSASASEILASALHDSYGAILVGETSYGKGKVQQTKSLSDGSMVKYTSAKWLTPAGKCIDEIGIEPEHHVENEYIYEDEEKLLIKEIIDKQLPKAIELLTQ